MCVAGWTSSGADCEARAVAEVEVVVERGLRLKRDVAGRVLLRPKRDVAGRVLLGPKRDVAGRVLLGPKRDVAGRVLLGPKRDVAGRVLLGPKRDVAGRVLQGPERDVAGRVGGRDESSWPGLSSWEEVAKKSGSPIMETTWWNNDHRRKYFIRRKDREMRCRHEEKGREAMEREKESS